MEEEFGRFAAARGRALCRTAYLLTGDWQIGEDLVQEALTRTYLRRRQLKSAEALEPYARKVLVSLFLTSRRRLWRRELPFGDVPDRAVSGQLDAAEDRRGLWPALLALSAQQRAVLVLRYFEDLTETEIAAVLGCSPGAVKTHAARGLDRLRRSMALEGWTRRTTWKTWYARSCGRASPPPRPNTRPSRPPRCSAAWPAGSGVSGFGAGGPRQR